jgi:hypothetical protein
MLAFYDDASIGSITDAKIEDSFAIPSAAGCCAARAYISYLALWSDERVFSAVVVTFPEMFALKPQWE